MPLLYLRTDATGPHPYCAWEDEAIPPLATDNAHWRVLAETEDTDEAIWLFETVERELRRGRRL